MHRGVARNFGKGGGGRGLNDTCAIFDTVVCYINIDMALRD